MRAAEGILAALLFALLLPGCGGGGGGSDSDVIAPSLTLVEKVTNDNGGTAVASDWTLTAAGYNAADPQTGTYNLFQSGPDGYTLTSLTCDNAAGQVTSVTLDPGDDVTCTFVNDDDAPNLTLVKQVTNDNGGTAVASDWTLTATGYNAVDPQTGTYILSESGPDGYTLTSLTCDNAAGQVTSVTLGVGDDVTCTFVNDDNTPGSVAILASLDLSPGVLDQTFQPNQTIYTATVGFLSPITTVTTVTSYAGATVSVNGEVVSSGSASAPIPLAIGDNLITVDVTSEDGVNTGSYTLTVARQTADEFAQQAYIDASTSSSGDNFGTSIALSGDTLAVGVPFEGTNRGAVYIFTRIGTQWSQQAYIKASNNDAGDFFGTSIALSGDTLAVGATLEDSDASGIGVGDEGNNVVTENSGAVYVFTRDGNAWTQQAYIKASNTGKNDNFGFSLALFGDTLAVGAKSEASGATGIDANQTDDNQINAGAVYVFTRDGTTWSQQAYIKASNTDSQDNFGYSVALYADTLAVGAYGEDSNASGIGVGDEGNNVVTENSGAVYVFTRVAATWSQQAYIKASNTGANDFFGWSLSLSGDTLAVGAVGEASSTSGDQNNNSLTRAGAVYVFTWNGEVWSQQAYIKASNTGETDDFGWSLALSGDNLAVGAPREDSNSTGISEDTGSNDLPNSGAVYLFNRSGTDWNQWAYIKSDRPDIPLGGELFGYSVSLDGDTLGAGAPGKDSLAGTGTGAVFIYR
jgi:hypothetical protein